MIGAKNKNSTPVPPTFKKVVFTREFGCVLFHRWESFGGVAEVDYFKCKDCTARKVAGYGFMSTEVMRWVSNHG